MLISNIFRKVDGRCLEEFHEPPDVRRSKTTHEDHNGAGGARALGPKRLQKVNPMEVDDSADSG